MPGLAAWLQIQVAALALSRGVVASPLVANSLQRSLQRQVDCHDSSQRADPQSRTLHGRFLHITDFHPDELYKPHTSTEDGIACHRGHGMAGTFGAEKTDCDSPFALVDATLKWVEDNIKDTIDFVVWTGDTARHDSDEEHPRTDKTVLESNRQVANKMIKTFSSDNGKLDIPIVPTFGNNDFLPHNIMYAGPNRWLTAYADIWGRFIPEEQRHAFEFGGWFHVDVIPGKLTVFSLNTMYFFDRNAAVDGCAQPSEPGFKHMEWLRVQLELMRQTGVKAILIGHVPPARTESKKNWDETCWQRYTLWLQKYRDVVVASLYGHMNIDHFLLGDTKEIDLSLGASQVGLPAGRSTDKDSEFSAQSKEDYLQELRDSWADLPQSAIQVLDDMAKTETRDKMRAEKKHKKHHKKKKDKLDKIGGRYAERYQLSLVSPSVVPNYFPTLRVFEYNVTGLEDATLWEDKSHSLHGASPTGVGIIHDDNETHDHDDDTYDDDDDDDNDDDDDDDEHISLELRSIQPDKHRKKKHKGKNGKHAPKDPNLVIPADPPQDALPGPAYYPQQFTLTGYTQYFANLTHINNDHAGAHAAEDDADIRVGAGAGANSSPDAQNDDNNAGGSKWRDGNHGGKKPGHSPARPRKFEFEVEYSTFADKPFQLDDLTVRNYLRLAYHMGKQRGHTVEESTMNEDGGGGVGVEGSDVDVEKKKKHGKKKKKEKKKKTRGKNMAWLRWLSYAFVRTVSMEDLEDL
ncbi:hypothetical protein E4U17_001186 [Claviceps sp. LM77 group G4]|nr:hypothetical protein E4U17_001186 [Claviceps sp. LM77 group G4]KAG6073784.1 hypothetical protein E4U16_004431 [Claviceps sp. LM84 group G4]